MINKKLEIIQLMVFGLCILSYIPVAKSIGCYKCSTTDAFGTNDTSCNDPFNPGSSLRSLYEDECKAGIDNRIGSFPARYCLKVSGIIAENNTPIVIRTCTVSKLLDSDSSHSSFTLRLGNQDIKIMSGLIASCKEDGCNSGNSFFKKLSQHKNLIYVISVIFNMFFTNFFL